MASSDGRVTYSSLSKLEKENTHFGYDDINHHVESVWSELMPGTPCGQIEIQIMNWKAYSRIMN